MQTYLDLLKDIIDNGTDKNDRTGTGTRSVFGRQIRFDLSEGFPCLTTKKLHLRSIIHELLWFLKGETNIKYLKDNGVRIWDEWRKRYSLERNIVFVEKRKAVSSPLYNGTYETSGIEAPRGSVDDKLRNMWVKMMKRCYDTSSHNYSLYGATGTTVHPDWHDVARFINDVKTIAHWHYKERTWEQFELDKDYYGSNQYGPNTSVWLRTDENNKYTKATKVLKAISPEGDELTMLTLNDMANALGMSNSTLSRWLSDGVPSCLQGNNVRFAGWCFEELDIGDKLLRLELIDDGELGPVYGSQWRSWPTADGREIDQIAKLIDSLKNNPDSRRHLVCAWNVADVDNMALPPCHCLFQFYVADGKLSCQLYQRSADMFLGVPFNIASYALLTMMLAQVCDLELGDFVHTFGDLHLYNDHFEQAELQLTRDPRPLPKMKINPDVKDLFEFKFEDFELVDYDPHPHIKAKVSV